MGEILQTDAAGKFRFRIGADNCPNRIAADGKDGIYLIMSG